MTTAAPGTFLDEPVPDDAQASGSQATGTRTTGSGSPGLAPAGPPAPRSRVEARRAQRRRWLRLRSRVRGLAGGPHGAPAHGDLVTDAAPSDRTPRLAARRAQRARRRRQQAVAGFGVLVVAVVANGRSVDQPARPQVGSTIPDAAGTARSAAFVVAHRDATGAADLLAVIAAHGRDTATLLVPTAALVEVPSYDVQPVGAALRFGGAPLLRTALANALGLDPGPVVVVDDGQLAALLRPAGTLAVRGASAAGASAFAQDAAPQDAATELTDRRGAPELDHLVTVQAVMAAWFLALGQPGVLDATVGAVPSIDPAPAEAGPGPGTASEIDTVAGALRGVAGRRAVFDTLGVEPESVAGTEAYRVKRAPLARAVARAFTGRSYGSARLRVEILNGTGEVGLAQRVAARILPAGAEIVLTNNAPKFNHARTEVIVYDRKHQAKARTLLEALRAGVLETSARKVGVVDVTIVVGSDFS